LKGQRIGTPTDIAATATWTTATVLRYGITSTVRITEVTCLWFGTWRTDPVRVILLRDTDTSTGYDLALVTTDLTSPAEQIIARYAARWSIEVTFFDLKNLLGVGQARNRVPDRLQRPRSRGTPLQRGQRPTRRSTHVPAEQPLHHRPDHRDLPGAAHLLPRRTRRPAGQRTRRHHRRAPSRTTRHGRDGWPVPPDTAMPYHGPMSTNDIARYWHHHPHPVLLSTGGHCLDAFRLPEQIATRLLHQLTNTGQRGPVATLPNHQWLFLITADDPPPEALRRRTVHYHGPNNWIPAPPTRIRNTAVTWHITPTSVGWQLFEPRTFRNTLAELLPKRRTTHTKPSPAHIS
jgi:hypothetical protein